MKMTRFILLFSFLTVVSIARLYAQESDADSEKSSKKRTRVSGVAGDKDLKKLDTPTPEIIKRGGENEEKPGYKSSLHQNVKRQSRIEYAKGKSGSGRRFKAMDDASLKEDQLKGQSEKDSLNKFKAMDDTSVKKEKTNLKNTGKAEFKAMDDTSVKKEKTNLKDTRRAEFKAMDDTSVKKENGEMEK
jgi:hypothetical protein